MNLWLCLRFCQLPLEALTRQQAGKEPVCAVLEKQRVLLASDGAEDLGIAPGMGTATARALAGAKATFGRSLSRRVDDSGGA